MDISRNQYLAKIGGVGENFLITSHPGIETYFTGSSTDFTSSSTMKNSAIF